MSSAIFDPDFNNQAAFHPSLYVLHSTGFGVYSERTTMTDENTDDLCKDCGPTFTASNFKRIRHEQRDFRP
jgi:hypothetical protein